MFRFVKQIIISAMMLFNSLPNVNPLECIAMKNQECKVRPKIGDINSNNPIFYPFSIKTNKCSSNCNSISEPYAKICVPDVIKNLNVKVFNLMTLTNETRHIKWHESCKCICRLDGIICNSKKRWNKDKCSFECKELIDKGVCDKGFIWNPSNCDCECDKSCDICEYLDYSDCKCRKKLIDPLVEKCTENIDEIKLVNKTSTELYSDKYNVYVIYRILFLIFFVFFIISIGICIYLVYRKYVNRNNKYEIPY